MPNDPPNPRFACLFEVDVDKPRDFYISQCHALSSSYPGFGAPLVLLTIPHRVSICHKKTGRVGFAMSLYIVQEFLGVLLVIAGLTGTVLFFGIAGILFREGIRRALRGAKTRVIPFAGLSAKNQRLQRVGLDPASAGGVQIRLARLK
jgi:hypothetical protein